MTETNYNYMAIAVCNALGQRAVFRSDNRETVNAWAIEHRGIMLNANGDIIADYTETGGDNDAPC